MTKANVKSYSVIYWSAIGILAIGLILARTVFADRMWFTIVVGVLMVASIVGLAIEKRGFFKTRSAAFGLNSLVTVLLVLSIVGLLNFLGYRYPIKSDITRNQIHSLSDQSVKTIRQLDQTLKAKFITYQPPQENLEALLKRYADVSPRFELEYLDPYRDFSAVRDLGINRVNTLVLEYAGRTVKVDEVDEESVTNAIIKMTKNKTQLICWITGHGEKDVESGAPDGYKTVGSDLASEAYQIRKIELPQEGKIPAECGAIAIIGAHTKIFDNEVAEIERYLREGGRAIIALDVDLKGRDPNLELVNILKGWSVTPRHSLIIDPKSRGLGADYTLPVIRTFNREHVITKAQKFDAVLPLTRHFEMNKDVPASIKVDWLAKSLDSSWGETDFSQIASGRVSRDEKNDSSGPLVTAIAVSGKQKDSEAKQDTKIVAFGTSLFASNQFMRAGGNLDLFMNAVNWIFEDESSISIRKKGDNKVQLTALNALLIFWICVVIVPALIAVTGLVFWIRRKKL